MLNQVEEENKTLQDALVELKQQFIHAQSKWNDQVKIHQEEQEKFAEYTEMLETAELALTETKAELLDVQRKLEDKSCWEVSARANMIEMESDRNRLESELKIAREDMEITLSEMKTEIVTLTNEKNALQDNLEQTTNTSMVLQQELDGRQQKLEVLAKKVDAIGKDKVEKERRVREEAEQMIMAARNEAEELKNEFKNALDRMKNLETIKSDLEKELQETLEQVESLHEENMKLIDQVQAEDSKSVRQERDIQARMEREKKLLESHQQEIQKATEMNKRLRQQVQQKDVEMKELKETKNKYQREVSFVTFLMQLNNRRLNSYKFVLESRLGISHFFCVHFWRNKGSLQLFYH